MFPTFGTIPPGSPDSLQRHVHIASITSTGEADGSVHALGIGVAIVGQAAGTLVDYCK